VEVPDYDLPLEAIAQEPAEPRDSARLLVAIEADPRRTAHRTVADLPDYVGPGDLLVVNTTRVLPARLRLHKETGGAAEVLLLQPQDDDKATWTALVRPGRRLPPGTLLYSEHDAKGPVVEVGDRVDTETRTVRLLINELDDIGIVPLPPYIHRPLADPERYQTVYADHPGSVAAPTAGLHLTHQVLDQCRARGAQLQTVDLSVGLGTFKPITSARAEDHVMHHEAYRVPQGTMDACHDAQRVIAIGTTTARALETAMSTGRLDGDTDLYIYGDYPWQVVDVLLTNFHQPRSSLLLMLESFCGPRWRDLYRVAQKAGYRFLSFGDAMLVSRMTQRKGA
jgi:S-adenosylmethionine:tRNA ribosyltransferase-isomerase